MYIQDKVEEYSDEVFDLLNNGAHIYFCGLKGMMPGGKNGPGAAVRTQIAVSRANPLLGRNVMPFCDSESFLLALIFLSRPAGILEMLERVAKSKVSPLGGRDGHWAGNAVPHLAYSWPTVGLACGFWFFLLQ